MLRLPLFGSLLGDHSSSWLSGPKYEGGVAGLNYLCEFVFYLERRTVRNAFGKSERGEREKKCSRRVRTRSGPLAKNLAGRVCAR